MTAEATVWIVESGRYSDRAIEGVFSSEAAAEACAASFAGDWMRRPVEVTAYPLDRAFDGGRVWWDVSLSEGGSASAARLGGEPDRDAAYFPRDERGVLETGIAPRRHWAAWVQAGDGGSAVKVAAERIAEWRAAREGIA